MFDLTFWQFLLVLFLYYHVGAAAYTMYVHRWLMHRTVSFHPALEKIFQVLIWMAIGSWDRVLLGYHLVHHKYSDDPVYDPQSPSATSKLNVLIIKPIRVMLKHNLFKNVFPILSPTYYKVNRDLTESQSFILDEASKSLPQGKLGYEWFLEHPRTGPLIFLIINIILFGWLGLLIHALIQFSTTVSLVIVSDGLLHLVGYRNFNTNDKSTNLVPWGIIFAGEELHNNHHQRPWSANFAYKWWEFDIGYFYIKIFKFFGLATIHSLKN
jgi:stearoyl-CoA desaturase (delta-9 desaturase)